jgi:glutathione peroxidase
MRRSFSSVPGWLRQEGLTAGIFHGAPMIPDLVALDGGALPAGTFDNKVVLFVNVASQCGLTPQYAGLQAVADARAADGLVVVGVPCNQFGAQEPGTATEIATFCETAFGVTFPLLEKQEVNGEGRSALYRFLVGEGPDIQWNFEKFLVGRDGKVVARFSPMVAPDSAELAAAVEGALWSPDAITEN